MGLFVMAQSRSLRRDTQLKLAKRELSVTVTHEKLSATGTRIETVGRTPRAE
jgi:hypothetical protein